MFFSFKMINIYNGFAFESDFEILLYNARVAFQVFLWPIVIIGLISNSAVLCRIVLAPTGRFTLLKPFYRCALLSFATSDLLLLLSSGINTLMTVSYSTNLLWKLPDWTCSSIPYFQTLAIFVGALTLAGIAIDRYRALSPMYPSTNEEYRWSYAIFFNFVIWLIAGAASYPILGIYKINTIFVIKEDLTFYEGRICMTNQSNTALIYTILFVTIFVPLAVIFVAVHVLLALNIWQRQERSNKSKFSSGNDSQSTEFSTVSNSIQHAKPPAPRYTAKHIRRKKRTVNIILILILVFLAGRLPVWIFLLFKLHTQLTGKLWAHLQIIFSGLTFLNAALDPFLYAFLCEALSLLTFMQACCNKKKKFKMNPRQDEEKIGNANVTIVPRGPYCF